MGEKKRNYAATVKAGDAVIRDLKAERRTESNSSRRKNRDGKGKFDQNGAERLSKDSFTLRLPQSLYTRLMHHFENRERAEILQWIREAVAKQLDVENQHVVRKARKIKKSEATNENK